MLGDEYSLLGLGINCNDEVIDYDDLITYHAAVYGSSNVDLNLRINQDHHIKIYIYDILGRNHGLIYDNLLRKGTHIFPLSINSQRKLPTGQYFYSINVVGGKDLNKSFVVK